MSAPQIQYPPTSGGGAPVGGSGTTNTIPRWTGASTLGDSVITQNSSFIGVGTTSPGAKLHSFAADGTYQFAVSGTTRAVRFLTNATAAYIEGVDPTLSASFQPLIINGSTVTLANSGTPVLTVNASSNVGIGTTSPASALHVRNNTAGITLDSTLGGGRQYQLNPLRTGLSNSGFEIRDVTAGAAVISIDASQQVGIGTASPVGRTDIAGTSVDQLAWGLLSVRSSDAQGADKGGSLSFGGLYDATNSTHWAQISGRKENGTSGQYGGYLAFATRTNGAGANTERARIDSTGNLILNTASTGATIQAAGSQQGLKLPATPGNADAQTLDCYAEGTWTPTLTGFGGTTPTATIARYTRVGRLVTLHVLLTATGGNQFSSTAATTLLTLPSGMTPAADAAGSTSNSVIGADGPCVAYTNGNLYVPTFALRTANTILTVTYSV